LSPLRKRELAQDAAGRRARPGFEGIGPQVPVWTGYRQRLERERERERMLTAYAVALAQKRGVLGTGLRDLNDMFAGIFEPDTSTAKVSFYRATTVNTRHGGVEVRPEQIAFASIEVGNLDWVPAEPVEELLGDDALTPAQATSEGVLV
jgi:hypothetical protein